MKKRSIALVLALVLLIGGIVGGTIAWLTAESSEVTNTFAVGDITIDLNEHKLDSNGNFTADTTKTNNTDYKVVPGTTQNKDPFVTVTKGSEACYVYVTVTNNLVIGEKTVAELNINSDKWKPVETNGNTTLYRYYTTVDVSDAGDNLDLENVFTTVTYSGSEITKENIKQLENKTIEIKAYAHQVAGQTQDDADAAAKTWAGFTSTNP